MDINDIQNLQEAYNQMYQVDESEKWIQKAIKKPGALSKQLGVPEKENIPAKKLEAAAKKGGKLGKRARLAMTLKGLRREEIDVYDIVLTHLLDEGYAETEEAAVAIMVNMSEEWRDSILTEDPVQDFRDMRRTKENAAGMRGPELSHTPKLGGSAAQKPQPRSREFEKVLPSSGKPKPSGGGSASITKPSRGREFTNPPS